MVISHFIKLFEFTKKLIHDTWQMRDQLKTPDTFALQFCYAELHFFWCDNENLFKSIKAYETVTP